MTTSERETVDGARTNCTMAASRPSEGRRAGSYALDDTWNALAVLRSAMGPREDEMALEAL